MNGCPNCGRDVETHELFSPPRCPVVRFRFPASGVPSTVAYSVIVPPSRPHLGEVVLEHAAPA